MNSFLSHVYRVPCHCLSVLILVAENCTKECQNGGTLDESGCVCQCAEGYTGPLCEGEVKAMRSFCYCVFYIHVHNCLLLPKYICVYSEVL